MDWTDRIGRRLKPRDLHIFLAVAETGSMAKAAETLACSRPVVSKGIAELEAILGVKLFDRTTHGVEPTRYGLTLLRRSRAVFDELRQSVKEIEHLRDPNVGELRFGCLEPMMAGLAAAAIDRILRKYPRLRFYTLTGNGPMQLQWLRERKCELVISREFADEAGPDFDEEVLFCERLLVVASAKSKWAGRRKISLADLAGEQWIQATHEVQPGAPTFEAFRNIGMPLPEVRVFSDSLALRYSLLATGRFLTMIPASVLLLGPKQPALRVLPIAIPRWQRPRVIATLRGRTMSPVASLFIEQLRELAKPLAEDGAVKW